MIRLRPYKPSDAKSIVSWCKDEKTFLLWGGDRFGSFPISEDTMNHKYLCENGDCTEEDNFYPVTAFDDDGVVGHFIIRYLHGNNKILRFGWVIVDDTKRGHKVGQKMLRSGLKYAFEIMQADVVTIGVFENNNTAYKCYLSAGFHESKNQPNLAEIIHGEPWKIIELELTKEVYYTQDNFHLPASVSSFPRI